MKPKHKNKARMPLRFYIDSFLLSYPDGLRGKIEWIADGGDGHFTPWDKIRYFLVMGYRLNKQ